MNSLAVDTDRHTEWQFPDVVLWHGTPTPLPRQALNDPEDLHDPEARPDRLFEEGPSGLLAAADHKCWRRVQHLVESGVEVNHHDQKGRTALWLTIWHHGPLDIVDLLVAAGADVNRANPQGISPLWHAISHHPNRQVAECLWQAGASPHAKTCSNHTLLMAAAAHGDLGWVHRLLANGLDPQERDSAGLDAAAHALKNGHTAIHELLSRPLPAARSVVTSLPWARNPSGLVLLNQHDTVVH